MRGIRISGLPVTVVEPTLAERLEQRDPDLVREWEDWVARRLEGDKNLPSPAVTDGWIPRRLSTRPLPPPGADGHLRSQPRLVGRQVYEVEGRQYRQASIRDMLSPMPGTLLHIDGVWCSSLGWDRSFEVTTLPWIYRPPAGHRTVVFEADEQNGAVVLRVGNLAPASLVLDADVGGYGQVSISVPALEESETEVCVIGQYTGTMRIRVVGR